MPGAKLQYLNVQIFFMLYFKLKIIINIIYYFKLKMIINVNYLNVCIVLTLFLLAFCSDKCPGLMAQYIYILGTPCFHKNTGSIMSSISGDWAFSRDSLQIVIQKVLNLFGMSKEFVYTYVEGLGIFLNIFK
jgi:hypothetical protein